MKTEYGNYNVDDFIEVDGKLQELTVTITLCEYRNLITERERNEKAVDDMHIRLTETVSRNNNLCAEIKELKANVAELQSTNEKLRAEINDLHFDLRMESPKARCITVERN